MTSNIKIAFIQFIIIAIVLNSSCKKYLDEKSDKKFVVPSTLQDCQALLDFSNVMNTRDPSSGEISSDNYYVTYADWSSLSSENQRRMYTWQKDFLFVSGGGNDWDFSYRPIYYANTALETLKKINRDIDNQVVWDNIKGQALFWRAKSFFQCVLLWSPSYDQGTASSDLGIPLRLSTDFNETSVRPSVQDTYDQILQDLKTSAFLLPVVPIHVMRPSRPAAYALLARAYLSMRKYDSCQKYSDLCLQLKNDLIDYNTLNPNTANPFTRFNQEVIFSTQMGYPSILLKAYADSVLYLSYSTNDLRKTLFYRGVGIQLNIFKGNYEGATNLFSGIATDEIYLTRAECFARMGNTTVALNDLNTLMKNRWKNNGSWAPFTATDATDALNKILTERRKELFFRGIRWMDLKRLNKEGVNITLYRVLNGQTYTLLPNDLRYALPIPEDIITLSGMQQNPR
jgi:tetratricopeptide (TPR) repeat protein